MEKKKHNIGGNHPRAKFSDKIVKRMRELKTLGVTNVELAKFYGTTYNHIYKLTSDKYYYKHLDYLIKPLEGV